jgi:hypothetical protein
MCEVLGDGDELGVREHCGTLRSADAFAQAIAPPTRDSNLNNWHHPTVYGSFWTVTAWFDVPVGKSDGNLQETYLLITRKAAQNDRQTPLEAALAGPSGLARSLHR